MVRRIPKTQNAPKHTTAYAANPIRFMASTPQIFLEEIYGWRAEFIFNLIAKQCFNQFNFLRIC